MDAAMSKELVENVDEGEEEEDAFELSPPLDALDAHVLSAFMKWAGSNARQFIQSYFMVRQHYKHIFRNRQPNSRSHSIYSSTMVVPFTAPTYENLIVIGSWLLDDDSGKFNPYHQAKLLFTELDILLKEGFIEEKKLILTMDMTFFTREHKDKFTRYAAKIISMIAITAIPVEVGAVYLINAPDWVSEYTELFPAFNFHIIKDIADLCGFVPQETLPSDMGGLENAPKRDELAQEFAQRLCYYSSWLAEEEMKWDHELLIRSTESMKLKSDKKKRKKRKDQGKTKRR